MRNSISVFLCAGLLLSIATGWADSEVPYVNERANGNSGEHDVCADVKRLLEGRTAQLYCTEEDVFCNVDWEPGSGRDKNYLGVDIDKDGKSDLVMQSCSGSGFGLCSLFVDKSSGGGYEFTDETFFLFRKGDEYYLILGESVDPEYKKFGRRKLYILGLDGAGLVCDEL
ncbi:hypothetical protein [Pseudomonas sp. PIC25]|uniref:hypothetical protein n=1 Tax=Pseudomonas sp. PIC25 TaxID=1958773 RepID=UPI00117B98F9|nr:hypothetical protein [Pseudomonas sp. PIC25]